MTFRTNHGAEFEFNLARAESLAPAFLNSRIYSSYLGRIAKGSRHPDYLYSGGNIVGVSALNPRMNLKQENTDFLGEVDIGPFASLSMLENNWYGEYCDLIDFFGRHGIKVLSVSQNPMLSYDVNFADQHRTPKAIYQIFRDRLRWNLDVAFLGQAQISPSTEVSQEQAVKAYNSLLVFSPAIIAIFANAPFSGGAPAKAQSRLNCYWESMFQGSSAGCQRLGNMPPGPYTSLRGYFDWLFKDDTSIIYVSHDSRSGESGVAFVDDMPNLVNYFGRDTWEGTYLSDNTGCKVRPRLKDFEAHQFTQFCGGRIRFKLKPGAPEDPSDWLAAFKSSDEAFDAYLNEVVEHWYIEGRDPDANYPNHLTYEAGGERLARSMMISPAALQKGLLSNPIETEYITGKIIRDFGWKSIAALRELAIVTGLNAKVDRLSVLGLVDTLLNVCLEGLEADEKWMVDYVAYVQNTGKNGAARMMDFYEANGSDIQSISRYLYAVNR